jgi:xylulokinase
MLCGLTLGTGRADLARSIFEGVSLSLYDAFDSLRELEVTADELRVTGGGTKSEAWLTMLANTFGRECYTLQVDDGAAFGAAILAGVGIGIWPDVASAARELVRCERCVVPKEDGLGPSRLAAYRQAVNAERIIRKKKTE